MNKLKIALITLISIWFSVLAQASETPPMAKELLSKITAWSPLAPVERGLLLAEHIHGIRLMGRLGHAFGPDQPPFRVPVYQYLHGTDTGVAVYFPSKGEGFNFLNDWSPGRSAFGYRRDVAMYEPNTMNNIGLEAGAHIVNVEVNGGHGSQGGIHFIASSVELDTLDESLKPGVVLEELLAPYAKREGELSQEIREILSLKSQTTYPRLSFSQTEPELKRSFRAQWNDVRKEYTVFIYHDLVFKEVKELGQVTTSDLFFPGRCHPPQFEVSIRTVLSGGELLRTIVFDKNGRVLKDEPRVSTYRLAPQVSTQCRQ